MIALAGGLLFIGHPARAGILSWNNAAGGSAATAGNWSPVQLPTAADDLNFNLAATYSVTWNGTVASSLSQKFRFGTVTGTMSSPHTIGAGGLIVGDLNGDSAVMTLTTGTLNCNGPVTLGNAAGSNGTLNVNDDDADLIIGNGADLTAGNSGDAAMNITGGGRVVVADQFIAGGNSTSSPTILVSGFQVAPIATSTLDVLGVSQSRIGQGGDVAMTISDGAFARFAGDVVVANGSASNSSITIEDPGLLSARLLVDGDLLLGRNTSATAAGVATVNVNADGLVDVGDLLSVGGDVTGGTGVLNVNTDGEVQTVNMQVGIGGQVNMNGGTLTSDNAIANDSGGVITGTGVINADIANSGTITPTGTGLTINGVLSHTSASGINGTKIHFGPDGGYTGAGTCVAEISGDPASTITATGTLTIGKSTSTAGFFFLGGLDVGGNIVTLLDSNQAVLGGETTINSGRIECSTGIGVQNGGALRGDGLLVGSLTCSGILDPQVPGNSGGLITVQGNVIMNPTSQLHMKINGLPASNNSDRVVASGTASLNGTLHVDFAPGVQQHLQVGHQYIVLNAVQGRTGEFTSVTPSVLCNGLTLVLVESSTAQILLVRPPDCDINDDGQIDVNDLLLVITHWGPCDGEGQPECAFDVDYLSLDGEVATINVNDLLLIVSHWGATCP